MFMGEYRHNTDAKGRIIIPAKFRDELGPVIILTRGLDGCLTIYTQSQWAVVMEQLRKLPNTKKESRMYIHLITSRAAECELDAQGRILLPLPLTEEAGIDRECVVIGVSDHVEIWSKDRWDAYYSEASSSFEEVAEKLTDFLV